MPLNVIVVMDPIAHIKIAKDTTFAMLLEAQRRGHALHYVRPGGLALEGGVAVAQTAPLQVRDDPAGWYELGAFSRTAFGPGQIVLMRRTRRSTPSTSMTPRCWTWPPPPAPAWSTTRRGCATNEKLAALLFPQCCPPTLVSRDAKALKAFALEHGQAVLKPLDGMGGRSIFRSGQGDPNLNVILETLTDGGRRLALAQKFIPDITAGDKRILLVDGEPVDYCLARIPQGDEFRGNLAAAAAKAAR